MKVKEEPHLIHAIDISDSEEEKPPTKSIPAKQSSLSPIKKRKERPNSPSTPRSSPDKKLKKASNLRLLPL